MLELNLVFPAVVGIYGVDVAILLDCELQGREIRVYALRSTADADGYQRHYPYVGHVWDMSPGVHATSQSATLQLAMEEPVAGAIFGVSPTPTPLVCDTGG